MPDISAALALLKKPLEDVYSLASGAIRDKVASLRAASKVRQLHTKLWKIQKVKTIWNTERPLSLSSFYFPVDIKIVGEDYSTVRRVSSLDDFIYPHCLVFGTAGQGKSILMKYLVGREIRSGDRIPILCELRDVVGSIEDHLSARFAHLLGISEDRKLFEAFAQHGKLSFLLDGFDEIHQDRVPALLVEIDALSFKYESCRILLTSRPEAECRNLALFGAAYINPLNSADLPAFYKRVTKDADFSARLVEAVNNSPSGIKEIISTPLLATLLAISYRTAHKIPEDFSEFYEELFQVLLVRHDGSKMGWRRERSSKLSDRQILQVFEAFCFAVRRKRQIQVSDEEGLALVDEAARDVGVGTKAEDFLSDVQRITCLLLRDGRKYEFVHASVAHYFASRFVRSRSERVAQTFYSRLFEKHWNDWREEIRFLRQIDSHRFKKYFLIDDLKRSLECIDGRDERGLDWLESYLSSHFIIKQVLPGSPASTRYIRTRVGASQSYALRSLEDSLFQVLFLTAITGAPAWVKVFADDDIGPKVSFLDVANARGPLLRGRLERVVGEQRARLTHDLSLAENEVRRGDTVSDFLSLET
jgi:predicted NACHT family NTPase